MKKNIKVGKIEFKFLFLILFLLLNLNTNLSSSSDLEGSITEIKVLDKISSKNILVKLKNGDEILVPSYGVISTIHAFSSIGLIPRLVDINISTASITLKEILNSITPKTKAICYVNFAGNTGRDIVEIEKFCKESNLILIEDAAEMLGHKYKGKFCGSYGDLSIFSFYSNKHITTGEGGAVLTSNPKYKNKIFDYKNLCFGKKNRFNHYDIGWNYRYTNLQASLGISQISRINKIILKKKEIGKKYYNNLKDCKNIYIQKPKLNNIENVYWVVGILILNKKMTATKFRNELKKYKIETREFFWPMNKQDALKKYNLRLKKSYKNSEYISKYGLYLPSGLGTSDKDINYVCKCVKRIKKRFNF